MISPLLLLLLGAPPGLLAPSIADLDRSLDRLERLLDAAEEADAAWSSAQRAWVLAECPAWRCKSAVGARLAATARGAARRTRTFAQSARAEWVRARRILSFDAVRPLVREARAQRAARLLARLEQASRRYAVRLAWNERYVERWALAHASAVDVEACADVGPEPGR